MLDFFDEDFPLTKKQEEMKKAMEEAAKKAALAEAFKPAENNPLSVNTAPVTADEPAIVEQPAEAVPVAETVSEPIAEAIPETAVEPIVETATEAAAEPAHEAIPEPIEEAASEDLEAAPEAIPETDAETAESIAEEAPAEYNAEPMAESVSEAAVETIAEPEAIAEPAEPVYEAEPAVEILPETISASVQDDVPEPVPEEIVEPAAEVVSTPVTKEIPEPVRDEIPQPEPEAEKSGEDDEEAAIRRIFQPVSEESDLPESDNQSFSYEYDDRYFAEEETPAYRYGASASARRRTRPARSAETKGGSITVSTKTLLKVGAVVAATAAAVKLLSKKD